MTDIAMVPQRRPHNLNGGRPVKIDASYVERAENWLAKRLWENDGRIVPTVEGLARHLNIARVQMYENDLFKYTLEKVQALQAEMVLDGSLRNELNPTIAKLILSAKHGYVEKSEVANTHDIVAKPQEAIAQDFSQYVKDKTQAIEGQVSDTPASTTPQE
jgi:hypothetical protein